jgi:hypothetical protein
MAEGGGERTLIKIAIFCIAMSMISTVLVTVYVSGSSDYDYDTISLYRSQLTEFSGGQLVNDNPWVLSAVFTPFTPDTIPDSDIPNHIEDDNGQSIGWLFGSSITTYSYIGEVARIKLDPNQKSNQLLTVGDTINYEFQNGKEWWAGGNEYGIDMSGWGRDIISWAGNTPGEDYGVIYASGQANNWNYTGYRYVFDPVLPFSSEGSSKDGRLSLVWYQIPGDTGLSGALEIYGADKSGNQIKLGSISASEILQAFRSTAGYVQVFDFDFEGTHLNLTIQFDPTVYDTYYTLQAAWDAGAWSMAVSSASAGNFFDVDNSNAFNATAGSMLDTFIDIYTFQYPHFNNNSWAEFLLWMLIGLPMTLAMIFVTMRLVGGVFKIF